ncbi:MAG: phosphatidate cytidylyltransferase [Actinomycetota bacterium]
MRHDDDRSPGDDPTMDDSATSADSDGISVSGFDAPDAPGEPAAEVLSGDMDEHDPEATDELELADIHKDLDPKPAQNDAGFDGWLDGEEPEGGGPYEALAEDDDGAAEIADWMAFTSGGASDEPSDEPEVVVDVTDAAVADEAESESADDDHDDTIEFYPDEPETDEPVADTGELGEIASPIGETEEIDPPVDDIEETVAPEAETEEDVAPAGGLEEGGEPDPDELMVIPAVRVDEDDDAEEEGASVEDEPPTEDEAPTVSAEEPVAGGDDGDLVPDESLSMDTGEVPVIGDLSSVDQEGDASAAVFDFEELTEDHYLQAATREHQDLAAAIVAAEAEDTEQVALAAAIPGLDSGVVGFDDVVASEGGESAAPVKPPASSDLVLRVGTAVALLAAFFLSLMWRPALIVFVLAALVVAAGEFYSVLIHRGYKPVSIFGFLGIIGAGLGTVVWGVIAIPIAFAVMITAILLFDAVSKRRQGAVSGFAATIVVAVWVGGFGAFAFEIIASDNYRSLVLIIVASVAIVDIAAYFVGRSIGRRPLAPVISPKKTIEGYIGGVLMAFLAGIVASFFVEAMDLPAGLLFGAVVAVFAPLGDLAVSAAKRSLDIKDMGSILPGHGGLLDRIDAIIAVVPAGWAVFAWLGLL